MQSEERVVTQARVKVRIHCRHCGEKFTLRGIRDKGRINTGFKRCLCDNEQDLDISVED
jgi:hypothetical protein